jgi:acetyl esterase/lipase
VTSAGHRIIKGIQWYRRLSGGGGSDREPTLGHRRRELERLARLVPPVRGTAITPVTAGGVPAEWVSAPEATPWVTLCYFHGGAYNAGSPATHRGLLSRVSRRSGARVLSVDYRLAPEHPFPAALDDALTAYRWLVGVGVDPARIVVGGDSAGGGLATAILVGLREAGDPLPAAAVLVSPWADLAMTGETLVTKASDDPWIDPTEMPRAAAAYLGEEPATNPLASPLYADLGGLPPFLIQVGTAEVLLDDARRLAARLRDAGTEVILQEWPDQIHVFQAFGPYIPSARPAVERIGRFIRARAG